MRAWMFSGVLGLALALGAGPAAAASVSYLFSSGAVTLIGSSDGLLVGGPADVDLTGVSVAVDEVGLTLDSLLFTVGPTPIMTVSYGTFTSFNLDFATVSGTGGTLVLADPGEYSFNITLDLAGQFDASPPAFVDALFDIPDASGTGSIFIVGDNLILSSITIGAIDPDGPLGNESGNLAPLLIKGDFIFIGLVPEPGTALLLGAGLVSLAAGTRRRENGRE